MTILSKQTWKKLVRTHINPVSTFTSNEQEEVLGQAPLGKVFLGWFSGLFLARYFMVGVVIFSLEGCFLAGSLGKVLHGWCCGTAVFLLWYVLERSLCWRLGPLCFSDSSLHSDKDAVKSQWPAPFIQTMFRRRNGGRERRRFYHFSFHILLKL